MAMRAKLTIADGSSWYEWLIASRWGAAGEYLSVGRTMVPALADMTAPIHLAPRQTALARLLPLPSAAGLSSFLFIHRLPESVSVAGDFAAAEGYVRLHGRGATLRLRAEGRCRAADATDAGWRVAAVRRAWIGEFIEGANSTDA